MTMKTPEQMAEEYASFAKQYVAESIRKQQMMANDKIAFLAGYQAARDETNFPEKPDGWISAKDRLPEIGAPCLVTCHEERYAIAEYDGIKWTTLNSIAYYHPIVTHWHPLPEAPRGEG